MQIIPLVRAKYVYAYGAVLDRIGVPKRRLLQRAGLSQRVFEDSEAIIPAHQAWCFIGAAAEQEGIDDLGLLAGDMSIEDYGAFSSRLLQVPNLNQALEAFCQLALHEYSRADFYLSRSDQRTWFCRGPIDGEVTEKKHVELLVLTMMIATVRLAAGPDWYPPLVLLQTRDSARVQDHQLLSRTNVRFGNRVTAFQVPQHLLPKQLPKRNVSTANLDDEWPEYERLEHEFQIAIRQVIEGMVHNTVPTIGSLADALGTSVRTLQRRISGMDETFTGILETARMTSANRLIINGDHSLKQIAQRLGYSDQAHFTRAFRRWNGVSPSAFRRLQTASH